MEPTPQPSPSHASRWFVLIGALILIVGAAYGSYWYFIEKQNLSFNIDLNTSSASTDSPVLNLTPGATSITTGQPGYFDITIDAGTRKVSAVDLRLAITGAVTGLAIDTSTSEFTDLIKAASITGQTATIVLGSGATPKSGVNLKVARLTFTAGAVGTISLSTSGSQAASNESTTNILASSTTSTISVVAIALNPPTATLTASPTTIKTGLLLNSSATLTWSHNGTSATISPAGVATSVGATGSTTVSPTTTTTYTLTATNTDGSTPTTATITVQKVCDVNNDGVVGILDINPIVEDFGKPSARADFNKTGLVDIFDYNIFVTNFASQKTN